MIRAERLTVRYGKITAVRDVSLEVRAGQLVAVTGPSGAGKTSLLRALSGLVPAAEGEASYAGRRVAGPADAAERGVVLIPQGNALAAVLTALENVAIPLLARPDRVHDAKETALSALAAVGVDEAADQLVDELSGGQQQRVAVARGLAQQGSALLADEPTSELDSGNRARVMDVLASEARRGAAVIMATHDPETAELCDAELHLDEGVPTWARDDRR